MSAWARLYPERAEAIADAADERLYPERAEAIADAADERIAREGEAAPRLCGVPIGLKDLYSVKGQAGIDLQEHELEPPLAPG